MKNKLALSVFVSILLIASIVAVSATQPVTICMADSDCKNNEICSAGICISNSNGNSGSIWTTNNDCGNQTQNENQYALGGTVFVNGAGFNTGTYDWTITGLGGSDNSKASCDPNTVVASGTYAISTDSGDFCFNAYTIADDDCGEYKVDFSNKHDNYNVNELCTFTCTEDNECSTVCKTVPVVPEFSTYVGVLTVLGALGTFFFVRRN